MLLEEFKLTEGKKFYYNHDEAPDEVSDSWYSDAVYNMKKGDTLRLDGIDFDVKSFKITHGDLDLDTDDEFEVELVAKGDGVLDNGESVSKGSEVKFTDDGATVTKSAGDTKFTKDLVKARSRIYVAIENGEKVIAIVDGKKKTLNGGSTDDSNRGVSDSKKIDKFKTKIDKFMDENDTYKIEIKYYLSRKWQNVGTLDVEGGEVKSKWQM